jgi:hypothetical protein
MLNNITKIIKIGHSKGFSNYKNPKSQILAPVYPTILQAFIKCQMLNLLLKK